MTRIQKRLFELQDLSYRQFHSSLIPTVEKEKIIGVRTPEIKKLAKQLLREQDASDFLKVLPHDYYEENNLHAFIISQIKDFQASIVALEAFLPYIDNWATCDGLRPLAFKKNLPELLEKIKIWLKSKHIYTVRFAIEMLMCHYLDDEFEVEYSDMVSEIRSNEYYINMMLAWYFATALAKQYDDIIPYLEDRKLSVWVHNKTIQKAVESFRITDERKKYLKTLKR